MAIPKIGVRTPIQAAPTSIEKFILANFLFLSFLCHVDRGRNVARKAKPSDFILPSYTLRGNSPFREILRPRLRMTLNIKYVIANEVKQP